MTFKQLIQYVFRGHYTDGDHIVHRRYGRYPKEVPFFQGMTLYPGQTAILELTEEQIIAAMKEYKPARKLLMPEPTNQTRH